MSDYLQKLLNRVLPETRPDEDYFLASPSSRTEAPPAMGRHNALLAEIRRQPRRSRGQIAA